jgi:hypothetical protein
MTSNTLFTLALVAAVAVATLALGVDRAEAKQMRRCPDGSWVSCTQRCPDKFTSKPPRRPHAQAPKPTDPPAAWRGYVIGQPKPPIRPKS